MSEQIKIELSFTMEEMEDFLLYNYPKNYHWKDRVKKDVMVFSSIQLPQKLSLER